MTEPALSTLLSDLRAPAATDATDLSTVCVLCSCNCGLSVDVADGHIVKVRGDKKTPYSQGYLCNKAATIPYYVDHAQRVTEPLRRKPDGTFEAIDWDTAIREVSEKLSAIRNAHSPKSIGLVGIGGQGNHMDIVYGLSFLSLLGTTRWYNAYAQEKTQHHLVSQLMFDAPPSGVPHAEVEESDYILIMGTNPRVSNRFQMSNKILPAMGKDDSKYIVVVDPRETETTRVSDLHIAIKPGGDPYLLLAMLKIILSDADLHNAGRLNEQVNGLDELKKAIEPVDLATMAARSGVELATIQEVAKGFASAEKACIKFDLALEQIPFLTLISYLVQAICVVTENAGKEGGMVFVGSQLPPERNPDRFEEPDRATVSGIPAIHALIHLMGMYSPNLVPEEIMVDHPDRIRALIVEGANPILSFSDAAKWREAREQLELMVVIDPAMTETARLADYVLPVPTGYEKWEISRFPKGFPEVYTHVRRPVVPRKGNTLSEGELYVRLLEAMDLVPEPPDALKALATKALEPEGTGAFLMQLMAAAAGQSPAAVIAWLHRLLGPQLPDPVLATIWLECYQNAMKRPTEVLRTLGEDWVGKDPIAIGTELFRRVMAHPEGVETARLDPATNLADNLGWEDGKIRVAPEMMIGEIARAIETELPTDPEYPLVFASGIRTRWTANTIHRDPAWRGGKGPHCTLHISPEDAEKLEIEDGVDVRIATRRSSAVLPAEVDKKVQAGHVWIPNGFGMVLGDGKAGEVGEAVGVNCNELADAQDRDPLTGIPHHKYTLCSVTPVAVGAAAGEGGAQWSDTTQGTKSKPVPA